jgi:excisionase family DNA binding protein
MREARKKESRAMRRTKQKTKPTPLDAAGAAANGPASEIFTLSEAAAYLRLTESDVLGLIRAQGLPARQLGQEWRFLKTAIQEWLRTGPPRGPSKEAQLAAAGSWKDDKYVEEELKEIHRQRGGPMSQDKS